MQIKVFKLISGQEVVAYVNDTGNLFRPFIARFENKGAEDGKMTVNFAPYCSFLPADRGITLNHNVCAASYLADEALQNTYLDVLKKLEVKAEAQREAKPEGQPEAVN